MQRNLRYKLTTKLVTVMLLVCFFSARAQNQLQLPVDFMVENGNFNQTVIAVKKAGVTVFTLQGKSFLKIKLDFNNDYILSFSKPGYITKSIAVNTDVPSERMEQAFEPYKIGVKIFRQYEGVNIVVYNQPVARIHFNPSIDDFDYDVDYTKSILSILKKTEDELMVKAAEERASGSGSRTITHDETGSDDQHDAASSGQMSEHTAESNTPDPQQRQQAITEPPLVVNSISTATPAAEPPPSPGAVPGEDAGNKSAPSLSQEKNKAVNGIADQDHYKNGGVSSGDDPNANPVEAGAVERNNVSLISSLGDDLKSAGSSESDMDIQGAKNISKEYSTSGKYILVESNRTITTFKIAKGVSIAEYRKVDYKWGGVFYFMDGNYAISRNVFHWATGEF
ncbi:MAG: hypothetical protein ABI772_06560 [Bacteroidota bacterium]